MRTFLHLIICMLSYFGLTYGCGLEVKSWPWVIAMYSPLIITGVIIDMATAIKNQLEKG